MIKRFRSKFFSLYLLYLTPILLGGLLIRIYRIGEPFGGFQAFNEGFYAFLAEQYFEGSFLYPKTWNGGVDYMVPPFHSYWLFFLKSLFGISEAVDRWGSVVPNMLTLYVIFLLGKKLFNEKIGLMSASLLAFIPMNVLVGRNVQVDATYIFFALTSLYFYLKSLEGNELRNKALSGISLGLSLFSKQFAVFIYPAIILWELCGKRNVPRQVQDERNAAQPQEKSVLEEEKMEELSFFKGRFHWLNGKFLIFLAGSLAIPTPFYLYHILINSTEFWRIQKLQGDILQMPTLPLLKFHNTEAFWGLTPLIYFLGGVSVIWFLLSRRRDLETSPARFLLLILFGIYLSFYLCTNKHSYYLLMLAPLLSLMIGKFLHDLFKNPFVLAGVLGLTLITLMIFSLVTLMGNKYGQKAFKDMGIYLEGVEKEAYYLIVSGHILGAYGPIIRYYAPSSRIIDWDDPSFFEGETGELKIEANKPVYFLESFRQTSNSPTRIFYNELWGLVLRGKILYQIPVNHHFFTYDKIGIEDSKDSKLFGFAKMGEIPVISITRLPEDIKIFKSSRL